MIIGAHFLMIGDCRLFKCCFLVNSHNVTATDKPHYHMAGSLTEPILRCDRLPAQASRYYPTLSG